MAAPFYGAEHVRRNMAPTNIMTQPGGFRAVTGGPSIFGNPYYNAGGYGYGNYGYGNYGYNSGYGYTADGHVDDGKLTLGQKTKSIFKGVGKTILNGAKSLLTPKGFLKAAAIGAACVLGGPVVTAVVAGIGFIKGASTIINGYQQASQATTDAEAEAAYENIGGGALTTVASAVAFKGAAGAIKSAGGGSYTAGIKNSLKKSAIGKTFKSIKDNGVSETVENSGIGKAIKNIKDNGVTKTVKNSDLAKYTKNNTRIAQLKTYLKKHPNSKWTNKWNTELTNLQGANKTLRTNFTSSIESGTSNALKATSKFLTKNKTTLIKGGALSALQDGNEYNNYNFYYA